MLFRSRTWKFPEFAKDIFSRRLRAASFHSRDTLRKSSLTDALGSSPKPQVRAMRYASTQSGIELIKGEMDAITHLPADWREYIERLAKMDLLVAWLACAWVRQKSNSSRRKAPDLGAAPTTDAKPWKPYWFKERVQHALMQIASANRQALAWSGEEDVLSLSEIGRAHV